MSLFHISHILFLLHFLNLNPKFSVFFSAKKKTPFMAVKYLSCSPLSGLFCAVWNPKLSLSTGEIKWSCVSQFRSKLFRTEHLDWKTLSCFVSPSTLDLFYSFPSFCFACSFGGFRVCLFFFFCWWLFLAVLVWFWFVYLLFGFVCFDFVFFFSLFGLLFAWVFCYQSCF